MFACEFYRWVEAIRGNNYCWSSVCGSGESSVPTLGMLPMQPGLLRGFASLGEAGRTGVSPHTCPQALAVAPAELGSPVPAGLHRLCPPALAATIDTHPQLHLIFVFPFYSLLFLFFLPFFFSRSYWGWVTPGSLTQSICAHSALTCICHSLYTHTFGHVTSISQFGFPLYFILPLVSLCQKKAEGGAVRKTFLL